MGRIETRRTSRSRRLVPGELARVVREVAAAGLASAAAAVLVGGVGGRLVMRVSGLLNPDLAGALTENGNRVGEFTADGTIGLILFGGLFAGVTTASLWVLVRSWIPPIGAGRSAHSWGAAIAAVGLVGFAAISPDNVDFFILRPRAANVVMFAGLVALAGAVTALLDDVFVGRLGTKRRFTPVALVVVAVGTSLSFPALASFFSEEFCFCSSPPRWAGVFLLGTAVATGARYLARLRGTIEAQWVGFFGTAMTLFAVGAGMVYFIAGVAEIL